MSEVLQVGISAELADKIREHGVETYPYECCGALLGTDYDGLANEPNREYRMVSREVRSLFPLVNRRDDSPRNRFSVTAEDVREAEKAAARKDWRSSAGIIRIPTIRRAQRLRSGARVAVVQLHYR